MKPNARVLLVDDDPAAVEALQRHLAGLGHTTSLVPDGVQAMLSARRDPPELAVLEVALPEVDGFQLCRELKRLERPPTVVMLTARDTPEDRFWAAECGADLFVTKPADAEALVRAVDALPGGR